MRERRQRSKAIAKVRLGPVERRKLSALGYLEDGVAGDKGPAFDVAAEGYFSEKLAGRGAIALQARAPAAIIAATLRVCAGVGARDRPGEHHQAGHHDRGQRRAPV